MNELIAVNPTEFSGQQIPTVNARDLHEFLESKQQFADWIKNRIKKYGFVQDVDFTVIHNFTNNPDGGRPTDGYHLTLDMAKELSMVERNDKGKQARQYFLECERKVIAPPTDHFALPQNMAEALRLAADAIDQNNRLTLQIDSMTPTVKAFERIALADGSECITDAAKILQARPKDLFQWLSAHQWIYRRPGGSGWIAYQNRLQQGLLEHKIVKVEHSDGREQISEQVRVTPKGLSKLSLVFGKEEVEA